MQQIINFVLRYRNFLLYILLLIISLGFTIRSHTYHQSRFFNSANWISGNIYNTADGITSYFGLRQENTYLVEENQRLRNLLFNKKVGDSVELDSANLKYAILSGKVIKNSYADPRNYITINRGEKDGLQPDMGVITARGILGIVENVSSGFATVQSILNENSNINAKIKGTDHFGSLIWDGQHYNTVQLVDIPRLVPLIIGDTVVTGAMSSIFPENVPIGTIKKFDLDTSNSFYSIDLALFNDMTNLKNVYIINNKNREEIQELEAKTLSDDQ
ncbi:MAG: rod shape-determining protein MreC [Bacteroidota bacterium]